MKRGLLVILALMVLLTGCTKGKPKDMPQGVYDQGVRVVNIINEYYKGTATIDKIRPVLDEASDYVSKQWSSDLPSAEQLQIIKVNNCLTPISLALTELEYGWALGSDQDAKSKELKKAQKELKKALNM